jgi:hypothetical protein
VPAATTHRRAPCIDTDPVSNRDERAHSEVELPPVDRTWWSWGGAHGGLLAALLLRQARTHAPELRPRSLYTSLLVPADARPVRPLGGGTEPVLTAWLRLKEPAFSPAGTALVLLDSMPPALYAATTEPVVAPTADFAVHFADGLATADLGDWTLIRTQVEQASSGWMVDSIRLWRPDGALLATARQTRRILAPR